MKGPGISKARQVQLMLEQGITPPPVKTSSGKEIIREYEDDGSFFKHDLSKVTPWDGIVRYSQIRRPDKPGREPVQLTLFCEKCGGSGCGERSTRIDDDHYCVQGMKLRREQTWVMKHMTIVSGKETCAENFLPKLLILHKHLNLDIANATVRPYEAA